MTVNELIDELHQITERYPDAGDLPVVTPPDAIAALWGEPRNVTSIEYARGKGILIQND
jgi:hypothetical protein